MEFLIINHVRRNKALGILARRNGEVGLLTTTNLVKKVVQTIIQKEKFSIEKRTHRGDILKKVVTSGDQDYIKSVGYLLEPPLRKSTYGEVRVNDLLLGLQKLWKIYIGPTPPSTEKHFHTW